MNTNLLSTGLVNMKTNDKNNKNKIIEILNVQLNTMNENNQKFKLFFNEITSLLYI